LAKAQCLAHDISYQQNNDQYSWVMEWSSNKPFSTYQKYFGESAGDALVGKSEVVDSMWWKKRGTNEGELAAWVWVTGVSREKKYFVRNCKLTQSSVFCQLDTNQGGGGERINWAWSKISCAKSGQTSKCRYEEAGSVKSAAGGFVSAPTIAVAVNTQSMKDTLRLALASELGPQSIGVGFANGRRGADLFWDKGQRELNAGRKVFKVQSNASCPTR
jgi:hypothetical protein